MSKTMGGFSGKALTPESPWAMVKLFLAMLPAAMFANKFLQGNVWGIPNKEHGVIPIKEVMRPPIDKYVDGYVEHSMDTSGFVGDDESLERQQISSSSSSQKQQQSHGGNDTPWKNRKGGLGSIFGS